MASLDINSTIVLVTLFIIYGIFLCYDLLKRNEKYGYLAYIIALIPANFLWFLNFDVLGVYLVMFILWDICLIRDLWGVAEEKKRINDIILYLLLAIVLQLILAAVLPVSFVNLRQGTTVFWFFWLPDLYGIPQNLGILTAFRISASILVGLVIVPLLIDLKGEEVPLPVFIIIIGLFILPFLYLSYIWVPEATAVLTFLMSVILFIVLLLITRSGKEEKTTPKTK